MPITIRRARGPGAPGYQGRFKSFVVKDDVHLFLVLRYVERNALRANLVERAEDWNWCSLWRRENSRRSGDAFRLASGTSSGLGKVCQ